jgi:hypothetical protein
VATLDPLASDRSSGSRVSRPVRRTLFMVPISSCSPLDGGASCLRRVFEPY